MADATGFYVRREAELGEEQMREVERQVMLRIIDQRWREHLEEMDYLQEGINLRAMGQKDPLTEWQREGFELFGQMMKAIAQDFVRFVMHVQVVQPVAPTLQPQKFQQFSSDNALASGFDRAAAAAVADGELPPSAIADYPGADAPQTPVVKDALSKTPRNAPCPCGSGKKFKQCHGVG
jgi:preprotein translocase subunit SecA